MHTENRINSKFNKLPATTRQKLKQINYHPKHTAQCNLSRWRFSSAYIYIYVYCNIHVKASIAFSNICTLLIFFCHQNRTNCVNTGAMVKTLCDWLTSYEAFVFIINECSNEGSAKKKPYILDETESRKKKDKLPYCDLPVICDSSFKWSVIRG